MEYFCDAIVILVLAVVVGLAIRSLWKEHKKGGCGSCGGCSGCSGCSGCGCGQKQR